MSSIQEILGKTKFTKTDLINKCKALGIRGYSTLKKQELILKIETFITSLESTGIENTHEDIVNVISFDNSFETNNAQDNIINNFSKKEDKTTTPRTRDIETQVNLDDFKTKEIIPRIHCGIIDKTTITSKTSKILRELILKTINNSIKYKIGDIILNEIGMDKVIKGLDVNNSCFDIICKKDSNKILINFDKIAEDTFIKENSYLKNINYDNIIMDMTINFKINEFESPIINLCILYAKINEKHHLLETIYEFTDPPIPVLSNNEVIHNPHFLY